MRERGIISIIRSSYHTFKKTSLQAFVAFSIAVDLLMPSEAKLLIYVQFYDSGIRASPANTTALGDCY